ncbi:MAG: hypothetical protein CME46_04885 [Halieaceae bacterium]|nr:hypothetical protein [Halieaceae bacterium]
MLRAVFVALWVIAGLSGCGADSTVETSPAVRPARLITVGAGDHSAPSQFVGKVAPAHTVELGFEIDGTLRQLPLSEGTLVQAGDVIAQLDPERFELALESAQADHELAEKVLSRVESLKASGTVSQAELDEAVARAKLTGLTVETAQKDLDDTVLRAPFTGQLTKRLAENFSPIARLSPVIRLAPVERIEVVIGVPEQLMARLNPATLSSAAVRFTADPERLFEAHWLDYEAEASRDTQTYDVRFSLTDTPPWPVLSGMTATVLLSMATPDDAVIQLPLSAVQSDAAGNFFVWTVERDTSQVTKRPIEVGLPSRQQVPVLSGLELGEQVVAAGGAWLYDGMQVRPLGDG